MGNVSDRSVDPELNSDGGCLWCWQTSYFPLNQYIVIIFTPTQIIFILLASCDDAHLQMFRILSSGQRHPSPSSTNQPQTNTKSETFVLQHLYLISAAHLEKINPNLYFLLMWLIFCLSMSDTLQTIWSEKSKENMPQSLNLSQHISSFHIKVFLSISLALIQEILFCIPILRG